MRHKKVQRREVEPDKVYNHLLLTKFINNMMISGKKTVAQSKMYSALKLIEEKGNDPMEIFDRALQNVGPKIEVKARRVGGANFQVPVEVRSDRRMSLAIRWILEATRKRSNKEYKTFEEKLAAEFLDAANNMGEAIKKRDNALKMADANRAFAHFRW